MHIGVVHTVLLSIFVWNIFGMELRHCGNKLDDRIVFPNAKRKHLQSSNQTMTYPTNSTQSANLTSTTELPPSTKTMTYSNSTQAANIRSTTELPPSTKTDSIFEEDDSNSTTDEPIVIDNRILFDTLPSCEPPLQLRAGRCRQAAWIRVKCTFIKSFF